MASECLESLKTVKYVSKCPLGVSEWNERARLKQCSEITNGTCNYGKNLVYHCLPNAYRDKLIEVCAPPTYIPRDTCPEYSIQGKRINGVYNCSRNIRHSCPTKQYSSINLANYPDCLKINDILHQKMQQPTPTTIAIGEIVVIVSVVLFLLIFAIFLYCKYRKSNVQNFGNFLNRCIPCRKCREPILVENGCNHTSKGRYKAVFNRNDSNYPNSHKRKSSLELPKKCGDENNEINRHYSIEIRQPEFVTPKQRKENEDLQNNFDKILKLMQVGTDAVRICFDKFFPKEVLKKTLKDNEEDMRRGTLRFQPPQLEILFPAQGGSVSSLSMDVTIMYKLLRNYSDIPPPGSGWGKEPKVEQITQSDDVERIRLYRNKYAHDSGSNHFMKDDVFNVIWIDLFQAILRLSGGVLKRRISEI